MNVVKIAKLRKLNAIKLARDTFLEDSSSGAFRSRIERMLEQNKYFEDMIHRNEEWIQATAAQIPNIQRLLDAPGIGLMTTAVLAAAIPVRAQFKSGRHLAAWIGLFPPPFGECWDLMHPTDSGLNDQSGGSALLACQNKAIKP